MVTLAFSVTDQEKTDIEAQAQMLGFSSTSEYLGVVLKAHLLRQHDEIDLSAYTADVLLVLPERERNEILERMAIMAESEYANNPELIAFTIEDDFYDYPPLE